MCIASKVCFFRGVQEDFEESSNDDDIKQAFRTEETLLELDANLRGFAKIHIEVGNYRQKVKDKYDNLNFLDATQVMEIIEKFKSKYLDIALV